MKIPWKKIHKFIQKYKNTPLESGQIQCLDPPYLGDVVRRKWKNVLKKIQDGEDAGGVYALILPVEGQNQLNILPASDLKHPYYRHRKVCLVGIADDRGDADLLLVRMMTDCVHRRGDTDLRGFFEERFAKEAADL